MGRYNKYFPVTFAGRKYIQRDSDNKVRETSLPKAVKLTTSPYGSSALAESNSE